MSRQPSDSLLNSLKGKIWLAAGALAVVNCICGLGAYLAGSFLELDSSVTIFIAFFFSVTATVAIGWWLANEVIAPIEAVSLLAKSLERSPSASLPKTTGSCETDELLRSLHRTSQQLQNLIGLMDDVASGKTDAAITPLENSDRLSASFQKLVSKVTDSIHAKQQLDELQQSVTRISSDLAGLKSGKLDIEIRGETAQTKVICDGLRHLVSSLNNLVRQVHANSAEAKNAADEARNTLRIAIEEELSRTARTDRAVGSVRETPSRIYKMAGELNAVVATASRSFEQMDYGSETAARTAESMNGLRRNVAESAKRLSKIRERSQVIPQVGRSAEELARRSNLIALNTSIHENASSNGSRSTALLAEEIAFLSERSEQLSKEILAINDSFAAELGPLETLIAGINTELSELSKNALKGADYISEFEKHLTQMTAVQAKVTAFSNEQAAESEKMLAALAGSANSESKMNESEQNILKVSRLIETLRESISQYQLSHSPRSASIEPGVTAESEQILEPQPTSGRFESLSDN